MDKRIFKGIVAAICLVAAGVGGQKAYKAYVSAGVKADMLLMENIEAISSGSESPGYILTECYTDESEDGEDSQSGYICNSETTNETIYSCPSTSSDVNINSTKYSCIYKAI